MNLVSTHEFDSLREADLTVGSVYRGGTAGTAGDDPIDRLVRCGNMGGFRFRGTNAEPRYDLVVLYTTFRDSDWPDHLDESSGLLTYYGDNKHPGRELHDTPRGGNLLLRNVFAFLHGAPAERDRIPPFFVFSKTGEGRDVRFHGVAAPGATDVPETEDLVATWQTKGNERFQNYRAIFSLLELPTAPRPWINDLVAGIADTPEAPGAWLNWVRSGHSQI